MKPSFRQYRPADRAEITALVKALYREDPCGDGMNVKKIHQTLSTLLAHPDLGSMVVFEEDGKIAGYSILVNFWSNERGGNVLTIDELYVKPEFRGQGLATAFIRHLQAARRKDFVALQLEVTPANQRALALYERLGFHSTRNRHLLLKLKP